MRRIREVRRPLLWVGVGLLLVDGFLLAAEVMHRQYRHYGRFPLFSHPKWRADPDGSFAEVWGYAMAIAAAVALVVVWRRRRRSAVLLAAAAVLVVVALDDMLQIHEIGGGQLAIRFGLPGVLGLRPQDLGELIVWGTLGVVLLGWMAVAYICSDAVARRVVRSLVVPFAALLFFAVAIDMLLIWAIGWGWSGRAVYVVSLVELVGELAALTALLLVSLHHALTLRSGAEREAVQ